MTQSHWKNEANDLQRFIDAQDPVFDQVCCELLEGRKRGHWMWFVFPQIKGLGHSSVSVRFAISSEKEAEAYLEHPLLAARLRECTRLVLSIRGGPVEEIFGYIDALKFRSSMTLFAHATRDNQLFRDALQKYFRGEFDPLTIQRLQLFRDGR